MKMISLVSPKISRDMLYIDDCVDLYIKIASFKNNFGSIYNMGSGKKTTIKEIVEKAQKYTKTNKILKPKFNTMNKKTWDQDIWLSDMSLVKKQLKWEHKVNIDSGIKKTYIWLMQNKNLYK